MVSPTFPGITSIAIHSLAVVPSEPYSMYANPYKILTKS